jgi:hypothetical protein
MIHLTSINGSFSLTAVLLPGTHGLLLESPQASKQLGQSPAQGLLSSPGSRISCRYAGNRLATRHRLENGRLGRHLGSVTELQVSGGSRLTGHHHAVTQPRAAGQTALGYENATTSKANIVSHLHEVVDLASRSQTRLVD